MKLVTFKTADGRTAPGALRDDLATIVDLGGVFSSMLDLIDSGDEGLARARALAATPDAPTLALADVTLLSPIPTPRRLRDCSVFEEHVQGVAHWARTNGIGLLAEVPKVWYQHPIYYKGNHLSVVGPEADIPWPGDVKMFDYELEIACVIGRRGKNIPTESAFDHVFGFMIFNDFSIRDVAGMELPGLFGPAKAKDFDGGNALGPWLVTKDEIPNPYNLVMTASLNGEIMGVANTTRMHHRWDAIVSYASAYGETLVPGEVIGSGTAGGGTLVEKGRKLAIGDVVEFSIDGLGTLRNRIVAGA
ncbi:fumarylacetoacetate hydrolase family protein [Azospirillum griseum]|uniref:Fumarylacetoacetate hydrolase family protein n=1 Tax=Azospirillum griseum TaxID=2496639 RepID=A0A3S0HWV7_9PROT|nr:fumarylacetoacetate hydrolase family protein [Azospirillum griseum]RTR14618.1 fumarylacetoacetate hydrolase family protein [Azospirillum griseum]